MTVALVFEREEIVAFSGKISVSFSVSQCKRVHGFLVKYITTGCRSKMKQKNNYIFTASSRRTFSVYLQALYS